MHRDKKVGLALAILLCSIVGAFFFRDDAPRNNGPELKDADRLDQEIARGNARGPYSASESGPRSADPRRPVDRSREGFQPSDLPDWLRENSASGNPAVQRNRGNDSRDPSSNGGRPGFPSDFNLTPLPPDAPAVPIPLHNSDWDAVASNNTPSVRRNGIEVAPAITGPTRSHVVTDGETLSSIAGKYLGSQTRYQEIFQANRDQLKSADDLKIGMKLTIPERAESRSTSGQRATTKTAPSTTDRTVRSAPSVNNSTNRSTERSPQPSGAVDVNKPKFKPAKSSPAIRRTTDASEEESLGNRLSQIAPDELLEIDDGILAELERDLELQVAERPKEATTSK